MIKCWLFFILHNIYYSTNEQFTLDQKTGLYLPVNHSVPFYPLQKYHYNGKHVFIDSLRVRVPLRFIKVLDRRMVNEYIEFYPSLEALDDDYEVVDEETGELFAGSFGDPGVDYTTMKRKKSNGFLRVIHGITYRFFFKGFLDPTDPNNSVEYLVLQISSKMVKREYFDGITILNINRILEDINAFKVVYLTLEDFLNGLVSDIDICINQLVTLPNLKYSFALMKSFALPSKSDLIKVIQREKSKNIGVLFNSRHKATDTMPFLKIYHKGFELESQHTMHFYKEYLEPMEVKHMNELVRCEFTIRNTKHRKYLIKQGLNADFETLKDLLYTPQEDLQAILKSGLPLYLQKIARSTPKIEGLTCTYQVLYQSFIDLMLFGCPPSHFAKYPDMLTAHIEDPKVRKDKRYRIKKIVETTYNAITSINDNIKEKSNRSEFGFAFLNSMGFELNDLKIAN